MTESNTDKDRLAEEVKDQSMEFTPCDSGTGTEKNRSVPGSRQPAIY